MSLVDFAEEYINEIRADAALNQSDAAYEFLNRSLNTLQESNELEDPVMFYYGKPGKRNRSMQIDGYSFDNADKSLALIISDFEDSIEPSTLTNSQIDTLYKKMLYFLDEVCNGNIEEYCDASDDTIKLGRLIRSKVNADINSPDFILKIRFFIITNKQLSNKVKKLKQETFNERPVDLNLWHLERFYELEMSYNNEPIYIDLKKDFENTGIPCIKGDIGINLGYSAYIAIIPGKLLADIYMEYGSRVLEGNVRAFLGTNGAKTVNSGIKRTIIAEPTKFFTYNNGIAATASRIECDNIEGILRITAIEDLQIINGGQTTASLTEAILKKNNITLDGIFVPMKLTVIEDRETINEEGIRVYDSMVENIAKYANSQNKVTAGDFFSNKPFHILMEKMSKKYLAPPVNGDPNPSGWYYERTKKKYNQEQMKMTKDSKDKFTRKFPKKQIIKPAELAKYLYALECKPDVVAKGENWIIKDFGNSINEIYKKNKERFNEFYFQKCVAAAIIYRAVDEYLEKLKRVPGAWYKVGGYKLNIVPYTISKISSCIPNGYSIDWQRIWLNQALYPAFMKEIEVVTKMTNDFICDSHGMIVTEYSKKKETWENYRDKVIYKLSKEFLDTLVPIEMIKEQSDDARKEEKEKNKIMLELKVIELGSAYWKELLHGAMERNLLNYKEISLMKVAVDFEKTGKAPSTEQAKVIMGIRDKLDQAGIMVKLSS